LTTAHKNSAELNLRYLYAFGSPGNQQASLRHKVQAPPYSIPGLPKAYGNENDGNADNSFTKTRKANNFINYA